jgi:hypothetical protein
MSSFPFSYAFKTFLGGVPNQPKSNFEEVREDEESDEA